MMQDDFCGPLIEPKECGGSVTSNDAACRGSFDDGQQDSLVCLAIRLLYVDYKLTNNAGKYV